jgi:hypothetical protein
LKISTLQQEQVWWKYAMKERKSSAHTVPDCGYIISKLKSTSGWKISDKYFWPFMQGIERLMSKLATCL